MVCDNVTGYTDVSVRARDISNALSEETALILCDSLTVQTVVATLRWLRHR